MTRDIDFEGFFKDTSKEAFDEGDNVFLGDEGGFDINLGELGLTVSAEVFVAETARDLEILFDAAHHEELLVLLRCLGESVEALRMHAGGHEEVTRAFGSGLGKNGGFDFEEGEFVEVVAGGLGDAVAKAHVAGHAVAAQVEVAILHAQVLVGELFVELEGKDGGFVDDFEFEGGDFDLAGGEVAVGGRLAIDFGTGFHGADDLDDVFVAEGVGEVGHLFGDFGMEDALGEAFTVAKVDKNNAAVVTSRFDPADEGDLVTDVGGAELGAVVSSHGKVE